MELDGKWNSRGMNLPVWDPHEDLATEPLQQALILKILYIFSLLVWSIHRIDFEEWIDNLKI